MTQINSYKKTLKKTEVLLNIYCRFASTIFEIVAQLHSTLNALDAMHQARSKNPRWLRGYFGGMGFAPNAQNFVAKITNFRPILIKINTFKT